MDIDLLIGIGIGVIIAGGILAIRIRWRAGKAARKGKKGERQVAKVLAHLKKKDFIVLDDLLLSSGRNTSQIDHIVVSTRGIFIIETKSHLGRISGSEHAQYWEQRFPDHSRNFYNPLLQNSSHLKVVRKLFPSLPEALFVTVVVFTEASALRVKADKIVIERNWLPDKVINRTLIPSERIKKKWWRRDKEVRLDESKIVLLLPDLVNEMMRRRKILSKEEMREIASKIKALSISDTQIRKEHISYAKTTANNVMRDIHNSICPRCGGQLIVRKNDNGEFLGCENFPRCRFSCKL